MESDTTNLNNLNWNAGSEYNKIIGEFKIDYKNAMLIGDYDACIELLSMDLDFSYAKIIEEAIKRKKEQEIIIKRRNILKKIGEVRDLNQKKQVNINHSQYKRYKYEILIELDNIRQEIWELQGTYGILYPQKEIKKRDPKHAGKHGFS